MKFKSKKIRLSLNLLLAVVFKALLREQETKHAIEDAEIKGLELQAQKEMLQHVSVPSSCYLGRHVNPPEQKVVSHFLGSRVSPVTSLLRLLEVSFGITYPEFCSLASQNHPTLVETLSRNPQNPSLR